MNGNNYLTIEKFNSITGKHFDANESNVATLAKAKGATEADVVRFLNSNEYKLRKPTGYHVLREFVSWYKRGGEPKRRRGDSGAESGNGYGRKDPNGSGDGDGRDDSGTEPGDGEPGDGENGSGDGADGDGGEQGTEPGNGSGNDGEQGADGADGNTPGNGEGGESGNGDGPDDKQGAGDGADEPKVPDVTPEDIEKALEDAKKNGTIPDLVQKAIDGVNRGEYHESMPYVALAMLYHIPVYLFGPSGSGKSYLARQAADIFEVPYHFTNKVDMKVDLEGYGDAAGRYVETEFYRAMKNGGVFFFDEADASDSNAFTWANAATSDRLAVFPVVGQVQAPESLYFIAAGNTAGDGADELYTARNALDKATLNRFVKFEVGYDKAIEKKLGSAENVAFVRALRRAAEHNGIELVASYRTIKNLEAMASLGNYEMAVKACVTAGMTEDDVYNLRNDAKMQKLIEQGNPFAAAL